MSVGAYRAVKKALEKEAEAKKLAEAAEKGTESIKETKNTFREAGKASQSNSGTLGNGKSAALRVSEKVLTAASHPLGWGLGLLGLTWSATKSVDQIEKELSTQKDTYGEAIKWVALFAVGYLLTRVADGKK